MDRGNTEASPWPYQCLAHGNEAPRRLVKEGQTVNMGGQYGAIAPAGPGPGPR